MAATYCALVTHWNTDNGCMPNHLAKNKLAAMAATSCQHVFIATQLHAKSFGLDIHCYHIVHYTPSQWDYSLSISDTTETSTTIYAQRSTCKQNKTPEKTEQAHSTAWEPCWWTLHGAYGRHCQKIKKHFDCTDCRKQMAPTQIRRDHTRCEITVKFPQFNRLLHIFCMVFQHTCMHTHDPCISIL